MMVFTIADETYLIGHEITVMQYNVVFDLMEYQVVFIELFPL